MHEELMEIRKNTHVLVSVAAELPPELGRDTVVVASLDGDRHERPARVTHNDAARGMHPPRARVVLRHAPDNLKGVVGADVGGERQRHRVWVPCGVCGHAREEVVLRSRVVLLLKVRICERFFGGGSPLWVRIEQTIEQTNEPWREGILEWERHNPPRQRISALAFRLEQLPETRVERGARRVAWAVGRERVEAFDQRRELEVVHKPVWCYDAAWALCTEPFQLPVQGGRHAKARVSHRPHVRLAAVEAKGVSGAHDFRSRLAARHERSPRSLRGLQGGAVVNIRDFNLPVRVRLPEVSEIPNFELDLFGSIRQSVPGRHDVLRFNVAVTEARGVH
mmetsp:Transcript_24577/g.80279  ORF Transcript_24577/g.80279 Transcript_24577/m.80279 type:complete len:336 (+) Transcript_24577:3648-4655(+)